MNKNNINNILIKIIFGLFFAYSLGGTIYSFSDYKNIRVQDMEKQLKYIKIFDEYKHSEIKPRASKSAIDKPVGFELESDITKKCFINDVDNYLEEDGWDIVEKNGVNLLVYKKNIYKIYISEVTEGKWYITIHIDDFFHKMAL